MKQSMSFSARTFAGLAFGVVFALTTTIVGAQQPDVVLYEQLPIDTGAAYFADSGFPQELADKFSLGNTTSVSTIHWWGGYEPSGHVPQDGDDKFLVRLYSKIGGTGIVLNEFETKPADLTRVPTNPNLTRDGLKPGVFEYIFNLPNPAPLPGGSYYLSVQYQNNDFDWLWLTGSGGDAGFWYRQEDTDDWLLWPEKNLAFQLTGTPRQQIPEPGSLALLLLAGAGLSMRRRRRHGQ